MVRRWNGWDGEKKPSASGSAVQGPSQQLELVPEDVPP